MGYHQGNNIPYTEIVDRLQEAAKTVYTTDKYKSRGEFGEFAFSRMDSLVEEVLGKIKTTEK